MGVHNLSYELAMADWVIPDPGDTGTIDTDRSGVVKIVTAGTETRTQGDPIVLNQRLILSLDVDGGDCTVTFSTAYDEDGNTSMTFDDAGEFAYFCQIHPTMRGVVIVE